MQTWWTPRRTVVFIAAFLVAALVISGGIALLKVHEATANWWPSAIPTRVQYAGRNYTCFGAGPGFTTGLPARGHTIGGGIIFAPSVEPDTFIVVSDGKRIVECPLSGGL